MGVRRWVWHRVEDVILFPFTVARKARARVLRWLTEHDR